MIKKHVVIKGASVGALFSALFLICMSFVSSAAHREKLLMIWSGNITLTLEELSKVIDHYHLMFIIVGLYLIGHFLMWIGWGAALAKNGIFICIGFLSFATDFSEYILRGIFLNNVQGNLPNSSLLLLIWWSIRELSIWMIYLGSMLVGIFCLNQWVLFFAFAGILTIPCLYLFNLSKIWFVWLIGWHLISAFVLWRSASHHSIPAKGS